MYLAADRKRKVKTENSAQDRLLEALYGHWYGRILLKPLVSPAFSRLGGRVLDSRASTILICPFIRNHSIDMSEYVPKKYTSYNDFFKREMKKEARKVDAAGDVLVSPCDSRVTAARITEESVFSIKQTQYTVKSLLRNRRLAEGFAGGYLWIFRLCVEDYHHYIYVDDGYISRNVHIPGIFHTVNPAAGDRLPIYKENTREYALLRSANFGPVIQMEVGAMLVGKIENSPGRKEVRRGEEKGCFAFGGSTVILMTQEGRVCPDEDILRNSELGIETKVKLGEQVGKRP